MKRLNLTLSLLLDEMKKMTDEGREIPVRWSVMHMYSSTQIAKILALRRGMDPELAGMAAALHDIATIFTGKSKDHAEMATEYLYDFIDRINNGPWSKVPKTSKEETDILVNAIVKHSQKDIASGDPFVELLKDVDSIDRYLHGIKEKRDSYNNRIQRVLGELGGICEDTNELI